MIKLGVLMDDIAQIHPNKDSSLAFLHAAQKRGWPISYFTQTDLFLENGQVKAKVTQIKVEPQQTPWFVFGETRTISLSELDVVLMRKDPPFDIEYIYTTYLLELAAEQNVWVINDPRGLRDFNEKLVAIRFPDCCPPSLVTRDMDAILNFYRQEQDIVVKPLSGMGGRNVFRLKPGDLNAKAITQMLTDEGRNTVMAQRYIPEISAGDKRILIVHGKPIPYLLNRTPAPDDFRGNLVQGATGTVIELTEQDKKIADRIAPMLLERGMLFVGIDVIGNYLTEVNVTSPTGMLEIEAASSLDISGIFLDGIEALFQKRVK